MKKIVTILFCLGSLFLTNSCMASPFGDKIALICASGTSDTLKLKMTPSEIAEWEKTGITGQASDQGTYYFQQQDTSRGVCYLIGNSKSIYVPIHRFPTMRDTLIFNPK